MLLPALAFLLALALIATEWVHRTKIVLVGASLFVILGVIDQAEAIASIDLATIGLLVGMMVIVAVSERTGIFEHLAIVAMRFSKGRPFAVVSSSPHERRKSTEVEGEYEAHDQARETEYDKHDPPRHRRTKHACVSRHEGEQDTSHERHQYRHGSRPPDNLFHPRFELRYRTAAILEIAEWPAVVDAAGVLVHEMSIDDTVPPLPSVERIAQVMSAVESGNVTREVAGNWAARWLAEPMLPARAHKGARMPSM